MSSFPLSPKYIDFINTTEGVRAEFLEGTTASGKTTVGAGVKFMRMVSQSKKKLHILASKTTGTAEKNIIQQDNGILDLHRSAVYCGNGDKDYKMPHIKFEGKIIFVVPYGDKSKWSLVLGGQYGCVYIDELNTADIDFVREISTRNDYLLCTLNPDDPALPCYKEFVNRSRPFQKYRLDVPQSILSELSEESVNGWRYWFFTFHDNSSLSAEDIEKKKSSAPKGTKLYKNKILGLRGRAVGLVFTEFSHDRHVIMAEQARGYVRNRRDTAQEEWFSHFSAGLDTAYSQKSPDTIAMSFIGITNRGRCVVLDERVYNNAELQTPLAPSDTVQNLVDFLDRNDKIWGLCREVYIDSADQATLTEWNKYRSRHGTVYSAYPAWKKVKIIDRLNAQQDWLLHDRFQVVDTCQTYIDELDSYSWQEGKDNTPQDGNDHMINSVQYAFIPHMHKIGGTTGESR